MTTFSSAFGQTLRSARVRCDLSQEVLGERVGRSRASIGNIEAGRQTVSLELFLRFVHALDVKPGDLLSSELDEIVTTPALPASISDRDRRRIISVTNAYGAVK